MVLNYIVISHTLEGMDEEKRNKNKKKKHKTHNLSCNIFFFLELDIKDIFDVTESKTNFVLNDYY